MTIRFDEAMRGYLDVVRSAQAAELAPARVGQVVVVRDLRGRLRLVIEKRPSDQQAARAVLQERLVTAAGSFFGGEPLWGDEMLAPDAIFKALDLCKVGGVSVLERTVLGADWTRPPLANQAPCPPRGALYGIKGGVGRSLALSVWARHLAERGKRVLVVDLDLESPGVSTSLLPAGACASFGVVDWLAEDAVGQADKELVRLMAAPSPLASGTSGSILVAPCGAEPTGDRASDPDYLAKLARAYIDLPSQHGPIETFADRLARMLDALEEAHEPDVVLLDSRAGLHDVAAITLTRLADLSFLFAVGTPQTWAGYRTLFRQWQRQPEVAQRVRDRLRMVAAQVPETERSAYLARFQEDAYSLFADTLYEEAGPETPDAFNFDIGSTDAPHHQLPIYWSRALQDWNPLDNTVTHNQLQAALGDFVREATDLLVNPDDEIGRVSGIEGHPQ